MIKIKLYWNMVYGNFPEEVLKDEEGLRIMRVFGVDVKTEGGKKKWVLCFSHRKKIAANFIR